MSRVGNEEDVDDCDNDENDRYFGVVLFLPVFVPMVLSIDLQ